MNAGHTCEIVPSRSKEHIVKIKKAILSGYFTQTAHYEKAGHYLTLKDNQVCLVHPSTTFDAKPIWLMYHELVLTKKTYLRYVTEIEPEWLFEACPEYMDLDEFKMSKAKQELLKIQKTL